LRDNALAASIPGLAGFIVLTGLHTSRIGISFSSSNMSVHHAPRSLSALPRAETLGLCVARCGICFCRVHARPKSRESVAYRLHDATLDLGEAVDSAFCIFPSNG
jgi:hypothetical protein